jgi:hypothetical protein
VFLTPRGDCALYVAKQTSTSFEVRTLNGATLDIDLEFRIVAPQRDYEDLRLGPAEYPEEAAAPIFQP